MDNRNKHSDVDIYTYDANTYTIINIPWSHIIKNKVYLNHITHMDAVERQEYDDLLDSTGTIIRFKK
jgi:predicted small secreted protein